MSSNTPGAGSGTRNIAATFSDEQAAKRASEMLQSKGVAANKVQILPKQQDRAVAYAEMRDEMEGVAASPGIGAAMSGSMAKGSIAGALIFTALGLVIGLVLGWLWGGSPSKLLIASLSGAVAGATFGFTAGGFLKPRLRPDAKDKGEFEEEPVSDPLGPTGNSAAEYVVEVQTTDESEYRSAYAALEGMGPLRLDRFSPEGAVVATPHTPPGESDSEGTAPGRG